MVAPMDLVIGKKPSSPENAVLLELLEAGLKL